MKYHIGFDWFMSSIENTDFFYKKHKTQKYQTIDIKLNTLKKMIKLFAVSAVRTQMSD